MVVTQFLADASPLDLTSSVRMSHLLASSLIFSASWKLPRDRIGRPPWEAESRWLTMQEHVSLSEENWRPHQWKKHVYIIYICGYITISQRRILKSLYIIQIYIYNHVYIYIYTAYLCALWFSRALAWPIRYFSPSHPSQTAPTPAPRGCVRPGGPGRTCAPPSGGQRKPSCDPTDLLPSSPRCACPSWREKLKEVAGID